MCTTKCPFGCEYCYGGSDFGKEGSHVEYDVLQKRIDSLLDSNLFTNTAFILIGGEPLLHPNFFRLMEYCYSESNLRGFDNHAGAVTAGAIRRSHADKLKESFLKPNVWQLSLHNDWNFRNFCQFLELYYGDFSPELQEPLRINVIFSNKDQGLLSIERLLKAMDQANTGIQFPRKKLTAMRQSVGDSLDPANKNPGFATTIGAGKKEIIISIGPAYGLECKLYTGERFFRCIVLGNGEPTHIVVDENGFVKPCASPNQRLAPALFDRPLEELKPRYEAWLEAWSSLQTKIWGSVMDSFLSGTTEDIKEIAIKEKICELCVRLDA